MKKIIYLIFLLVSILSCKKELPIEKKPPQLDNLTFWNITSNSVKPDLTITTLNGGSIIEKGFYISKNNNLTSSDIKVVDVSNDSKVINVVIKDLEPNTQYYVKGFVTTENGTGYSEIKGFKTNNVGEASINTLEITLITTNTAQSGGNILSDGGSLITEKGICWSINPSPTLSDNKISSGEGSANFTSQLNDLEPNTTYYVRAYVINSFGIGYGNELIFKTTSYPILSTAPISNIDANKAFSGGEISFDGNSDIISRGICWSTNQLPTIYDEKTTDGNGTGAFSSQLINLQPNTTYFVRAYATNSSGTGYGNQISFKTYSNLTITIYDNNINFDCFDLKPSELNTVNFYLSMIQNGLMDYLPLYRSINPNKNFKYVKNTKVSPQNLLQTNSIIQNGKLKIKLDYNLPQLNNINFSIPELEKNGNILSGKIEANFTGNIYEFDLTGYSFTNLNQLTLSIEAINIMGGVTPLKGNEFIQLDISFSNPIVIR